ncbi:hypothetical protein G6F68_014398 [Rhizopus microsporus]|nr:hypothetical protein G6F68_014398 [Rhizopus microsporus]
MLTSPSTPVSRPPVSPPTRTVTTWWARSPAFRTWTRTTAPARARCAKTPSATCAPPSMAATASRPRWRPTGTGWKGAATGCRRTWRRSAMTAPVARSRNTSAARRSTAAAIAARSSSSIPMAAPRSAWAWT